MHCRLLIRICATVLCGWLALSVPALADTTPQTPTTSKKKPAHHSAVASKATAGHSSASKSSTRTTKHARSKGKSKSRKRGQQAIDSERAQQIQEALIREHYLQGEPSGKWDATTQAAMQRYQADQGWQTKTIPDSRALIKLGLGPSPEHLLNPESAMTSSVVSASTKAGSKSNADDPPASSSEQSPSGNPPQQ
jgi:putative peptidoglycan binding protein